MKSKICLNVGKRISVLRKASGLTQEKLAELSGIDYKYLQKIEGSSPPAIRIDTLEKLAKALRIKPYKILEF